MATPFTIYSTPSCPYCIRAKALLQERGIAYEDIDLSQDEALRQELVEKLNYQTVPMIFRGEEFIGGFSELAKLDAEGTLVQ